jgi:tRNA(fMet)-specific endonuclease VapC
MKFMLDTNICVDMIRKREDALLRKFTRRQSQDFCVSAVTLSELEYGCAKSADAARNRLALAQFMTPIKVMPYDDVAAVAYGRVRAELERQGTPIGPLDTMIAAHALALGLALVTNNEREFCRVPRLKVQNWTESQNH